MRVHPSKIIIPENRYRKDMGNLDEFAESLQDTHGNIVPIIVSDNQDGTYNLIAGERRTRASILAGTDVLITIRDKNELQDTVLEIIENDKRKDFTWQEQAIARRDLHNMLCALKGKQWSIRKTSEEVKTSLGSLSSALSLAKMIEEKPELFEKCKTRDAALKTLQQHKINEMIVELANRKSKTDYGKKAQNYIFKGDCNHLIESIPPKSINAIISDPKYGIDIETLKQVEHNSASVNIYKDDQQEPYITLMKQFIPKASKALTDDAVVCMFTGFEHFKLISDLWIKEGFHIDPIPGIWHRSNSSGQSMQPDKYFGRAYEVFVYGVRGNMSIIKQGANVISMSGVMFTDKNHPVQKPSALMEELIKRFCLPGHTILDFMCGSGTTIIAAIKHGYKALGFEIDDTYYSIAINNVSDAIRAKDAGMSEMIGDIYSDKV